MVVPPDVRNKMLALNITLTEKLSKNQKKSLFTLICITEN